MSARPVNFLPRECDWDQPSGPALYRLYDRDMDLIYIGVSRTYIYYRIGKHMRDALWGGQIQYYSLENYSHEWRALEAERAAIKAERPRHNIRSAVG